MKKVIAILLAVVMCLGLAACGDQAQTPKDDNKVSESTPAPAEATAAPTEPAQTPTSFPAR